MDFNNLIQKIMGNSDFIKESAQKIRDTLKDKKVIGSSGGGMVEVTLNGNFNVISIKIDDVCYSDKIMLVELIKSATNDANQKAYELLKDEMINLYPTYLNPLSNFDMFKKDK